jgi:hypothetical protein
MNTFRALAAATAITCGIGFLAPSALAQPGKQKHEIRIEPPVPRKSDKPPVLWNYLVLIIIVAAAFGANMIPSKRGHQD